MNLNQFDKEFKNSKVDIIIIIIMGGGGVGSIIRDKNDYVSNRYSIAFPQL